MPNIRSDKIETLVVELKADDVRGAIIEAATKALRADRTGYGQPDDRFTPQLIDNGYGGFKVFFRKAEPPAVAKAS